MNILVIGCDGYIGYPLVQELLRRGHDVHGVDCFHRRRMVNEMGMESAIPISDWNKRQDALAGEGEFTFDLIDTTDYKGIDEVFSTFMPEATINLGQQPSAPYSMSSPARAMFTVNNNVNGLLNVLWAMREHVPASSLVTLGTMGEYGFPHMNIPEGFFQVNFEGMDDILPYPKQTGSVYHSSKAMGSNLLWMAARIWELRITEIQQGVVMGTRTPTMHSDVHRTRLDMGECFGTMVNRAVCCAVMGHPIIPYGSGKQKRAYIALRDSVRCLSLAAENHPNDDDSMSGYRVINQFDENYTCLELANLVKDAAAEVGIEADVRHHPNPRVEPEVHYYNPHHEKLYKMGWEPTVAIKDELRMMMEDLLPHKDRMVQYKERIVPKIKWRPDHVAIKGGKNHG